MVSKHWYIKDVSPRGAPNTTTDCECKKPIDGSDSTLFVVIVRNVNDWVGAMYKRPYHMKNMKRDCVFDFISSEYISYEEPGSRVVLAHGQRVHHHGMRTRLTNTRFFIEEAKNLIELRNLKNEHFWGLQGKVKHFYLIRQEHLEDDINSMIDKFGLERKFTDLPDYRKPTQYKLDEKTIQFIRQNHE